MLGDLHRDPVHPRAQALEKSLRGDDGWRGVDREADVVGKTGQGAGRDSRRQQLQRDAQPDPPGVVEPAVGRVRGIAREAGQGLVGDLAAAADIAVASVAQPVGDGEGRALSALRWATPTLGTSSGWK